jgi:uncharacterized membrane protein YdjX (TVP38/TMEM64 family)
VNAVTLATLRRTAIAVWLLAVAAGLSLSIFAPDLVQAHLQSAFSTSALAAYVVYVALGALRGFTLMPTTLLVAAGIPFFPPGPLLVITLAAVVASAMVVYGFAHVMGVDELLERRYPARAASLRTAMQRHQLPIIVGWSFFPLAPTDLIVYVCGALKIDLKKCLLGVLVGQGSICALYIFGADAALRWFHLR